MYVVCTGSFVLGFRFHGPFNTSEEALAWAQKWYGVSCSFDIVALEPVVEG